MTTPTPRTSELDLAIARKYRVVSDSYMEMLDHARQLERELNETRWLLAIREGRIEDARKMEREGLVP